MRRLNPFGALWNWVDRQEYFDAWLNRNVAIEKRIEQVTRNNNDNPLVEGGFLLFKGKEVPIPPKYHKLESGRSPKIVKEEYAKAYEAFIALRTLINQIDHSKARSFFSVTLPDPANRLTLSFPAWIKHYDAICRDANSAWEALGRAVKDAGITVSSTSSSKSEEENSDPSFNGADGSEKGTTEMDAQHDPNEYAEIADVPLDADLGKIDLRWNDGKLRAEYRRRWRLLSRLARTTLEGQIPSHDVYMSKLVHPNMLENADRTELRAALTTVEAAYNEFRESAPASTPEPTTQIESPASDESEKEVEDPFTDQLVMDTVDTSPAAASVDSSPESALVEEVGFEPESTTIEETSFEEIAALAADSQAREEVYQASLQQEPSEHVVEQRVPLTVAEMTTPVESPQEAEGPSPEALKFIEDIQASARAFLMAHLRLATGVKSEDSQAIAWLLSRFFLQQLEPLFGDVTLQPHRFGEVPFPVTEDLAFSITVDESDEGRNIVYSLTLPASEEPPLPARRVTLTQNESILK